MTVWASSLMFGYQGNQVYILHTCMNPERRVCEQRPAEGARPQSQRGTHHSVDAHRVGHASIREVHTLVHVHTLLGESVRNEASSVPSLQLRPFDFVLTRSDLFVRLGVVQSCPSQRRPPQAWRAGSTAEPPQRVHTGVRRETRLQRALQHSRGRCVRTAGQFAHVCDACLCL